MQIEEFLEQYKKREENKYILVHLTNYMPQNETIYSQKGANAEHTLQTDLGEIKFKEHRDTVHFTVNRVC